MGERDPDSNRFAFDRPVIEPDKAHAASAPLGSDFRPKAKGLDIPRVQGFAPFAAFAPLRAVGGAAGLAVFYPFWVGETSPDGEEFFSSALFG